MRMVFQNQYEVIKRWLEQSQYEGIAGNVSFRDDVIYSYGWWPMARVVRPGVVLVRDDTYSSTTSGHLSGVRHATHGMTEYAVVSMHDHVENVVSYGCRVRSRADKFWNARTGAMYYKSWYDRLVTEARAYVKEFGLGDVLPSLFGLELSGLKAQAKLVA